MRNKLACVPDLEKIESNPGNRYHQLYKSKVMPNGVIELIEDGSEDIWQMINADAEKTDMAYIIRQIKMGDMSAFTRNANYADITEFPTNYAEILQVMIDSENAFYQLPLETRSKFDNNFNMWLAQTGQPEWLEKMGFDQKKDEQKESFASEKGSEE